MSRLLATLDWEGFQSPIWLHPDGRVTFRADADIDVDGAGESYGDPYFQPDTTLHLNGKALNSDVDKFIVVPPIVVKAVAPVVLGCRARVVNIQNRKFCDAVVGDIGPTRKTGEISRAVAFALGLDPSPLSGGEDLPLIDYEIWPGQAAVVDGKRYDLQPSRA